MEKTAFSIKETAQQLGVSVSTVRLLMAREQLPHVRVSERRIIIPVSALNDWLKARQE